MRCSRGEAAPTPGSCPARLALGSTWFVTSIVIAAILACILVANGLAACGVGLERRWLIWILLFAVMLVFA